MLAYHPVIDANHCAFRIVTLLTDIKHDPVLWDHLKLLDFYLVFPHLLSAVRLPHGMKKQVRWGTNPYEEVINPQRLMFELGSIQEQTARSLVAKGILDRDAFVAGKASLLRPEVLASVHSDTDFRSTDWYRLITDQLATMRLDGRDGLKARTGLMEFRYDAV